MEIVSNSQILKVFSTIDIFKLDLGFNLTGRVPEVGKENEELKIKISDEFIKRYQTMTGRLIYKYGNIGEKTNQLKFYHDPNLKINEIQVHINSDLIYELEIDLDTLSSEPRSFLSKLLEDITNKKEEKNENPDEEPQYHLLHITSREPDPNDPEIDMDEKEYIKAMVERRQKTSPFQPTPEFLEWAEKRKQKYREQYGY